MLVTTLAAHQHQRIVAVYRIRWIRWAYWGAWVAMVESIRNANKVVICVRELAPIYWVPTRVEDTWVRLRNKDGNRLG